MADKYINHEVGMDGDGTTSNIATADGEVGAWNSIGAILGQSGSPYGSLDSGDTLHIEYKGKSVAIVISDSWSEVIELIRVFGVKI